ncbi:hypothetical protein SAMN05421770_101785 [Granulicella rosea]|uniref:SH3b domain-containing protein n=1 Tax=Granulicella rosea TaxID=474952 RepID=A0A239E658_9BACT|nr:SH3 domain-containing protein [Granulicella rosea]SNS39364.1 hypothetical protein SAMN05421770_101785 [Granulicella rosea]
MRRVQGLKVLGVSTAVRRRLALAALSVSLLPLALAGCSRLKPKPPDVYVYVTSKQGYLRDRVAAVSNRTGQVQNGDKLKVLDHARKFVKVQTAKGEIGWIEERALAPAEVPGEFDALKEAHKNDPAVASAVVRDEVYLHLKPGRETEKFYRLQEGEKLKLLSRATLERLMPGQSPGVRAQRAIPQAAGTNAAIKPKEGDEAATTKVPAPGAAAAKDAPVPPPPTMEDWWLVRDSQGRTGWMFARMMDVDAPDSLTRYAEGQRIVGAYVLTTVNDPDAEQADKNIPIYVTVMSPYKAGLPYDFDQVRVFTWSVKKHRYETGFRERNIEGFLPMSIKVAPDPTAKPGSPQAAPAPTFSYRVLSADSGPVVPDPETGLITPGKTITKTFRLENNYVRRVTQPGAPPVMEAHPDPIVDKKKDAKGKKKK